MKNIFCGSKDVPLSDEGLRQADALAKELRMVKPDAFFASELTRARQTAEPVAREWGVQPVFLAELRERNFGRWEGLGWEEVTQKFPAEAEAYLNNWDSATPPGGEAVKDFRVRVLGGWEAIWSAEWERVAVVAHGGVNRLLLGHFLGLPESNLFRFRQDYAARNEVRFTNGIPEVVELNRRPGPAHVVG